MGSRSVFKRLAHNKFIRNLQRVKRLRFASLLDNQERRDGLEYRRYLHVDALLDHIEVEFVPQCQSSKLPTGKFRKWTEIETIDTQEDAVDEKGTKSKQGVSHREELHPYYSKSFADCSIL